MAALSGLQGDTLPSQHVEKQADCRRSRGRRAQGGRREPGVPPCKRLKRLVPIMRSHESVGAARGPCKRAQTLRTSRPEPRGSNLSPPALPGSRSRYCTRWRQPRPYLQPGAERTAPGRSGAPRGLGFAPSCRHVIEVEQVEREPGVQGACLTGHAARCEQTHSSSRTLCGSLVHPSTGASALLDRREITKRNHGK